MVQSPVQQTTVTEILVDAITSRTDRVFGLIGNGNVELVSALTSNEFPFTMVRHEVAAVTAADAYFRATGTLAVATATYGAGFTNMTTGLAEAQLARIPMVVVVGDAPSTGRRPFDIDQQQVTVGLNIPVITVEPAKVAQQIARAFDMAADGQEPVVVLVPYDLTDAPVSRVEAPSDYTPIQVPEVSDTTIGQLAQALVTAKRPLILAGGGVVRTNTGDVVRALGDAVGAVFMHSLTASHVTGTQHSLGIAGGFTPEHKLPAVQAADLVLILGATSNAFQTRKGQLFATDNIFRIALDTQWNVTLPQATTIRGDLADVLPRLHDAVRALAPQPAGYRAELAGLLAQDGLAHEPAYGTDGRLNPRLVAERLNTVLPANRQIVLDGGHFITWIGERVHIPEPAGMIAVGTAFQSIGLGFGSAVGATTGTPEKFTACITGDGGGQMALADLPSFLQTVRHGAVIVFNDAAYGAEIHQYAVVGADPTAMYLPAVDFAAVGAAFGAEGFTVDSLEDLDAFAAWIRRGEGVAVVNINISTEFAHPALRPGATG